MRKKPDNSKRNWDYLRGSYLENHRDWFIKKFIAKINKDCAGGCWLWKGAKFQSGYGRVKSGKREMNASRASYICFVGEIPEGMNMCHKCDNKLCVNPDHLFPGTQKENMIDMRNKNRHNFWGHSPRR